jgi:hypothetical protein
MYSIGKYLRISFWGRGENLNKENQKKRKFGRKGKERNK